MTKFPALDGVTSATPLKVLSDAMAAGTRLDLDVTSMFLGTANGVIGSSIVALLIGGLVLWGLDIIHGEICFSVLGAFTLVMGLFGGRGFEPTYLAAQLCGGGVVMGAFFMATDYVTSPVTKRGQILYGIGCGALTVLFRYYGLFPEGVTYAILLMNLCVWTIDRYTAPRIYGHKKGGAPRA
jgi:electron transport complex protein RnfD